MPRPERTINRRGNAREFIEKRRGVSDLTSALSGLLPFTSGFSLRLNMHIMIRTHFAKDSTSDFKQLQTSNYLTQPSESG